MKLSRNLLLAPVLLTLLSGCVIAVNTDDLENDPDDWSKRAEDNRDSLRGMSVGRSMNSIVNEMGDPDISEAFERDGKTYHVYYYRTQRVRSDYRTTKDEATPLVFVDGVLVGWGEIAIENAKISQ
ncbi:DUF3192 domain-containing protein [Aurantivibrio infirmus]